jgi:hypothetical protein
MRSLNLKRGYNRIFAVLAVMWAIYCAAIYPLQQRVKAVRHYEHDVAFCYEFQGPQREECLVRAESERQTSLELWTPKSLYVDGLWLLLLAVIVPPLIVYAITVGITAVFLWIVRGFRAKENLIS